MWIMMKALPFLQKRQIIPYYEWGIFESTPGAANDIISLLTETLNLLYTRTKLYLHKMYADVEQHKFLKYKFKKKPAYLRHCDISLYLNAFL